MTKQGSQKIWSRHHIWKGFKDPSAHSNNFARGDDGIIAHLNVHRINLYCRSAASSVETTTKPQCSTEISLCETAFRDGNLPLYGRHASCFPRTWESISNP